MNPSCKKMWDDYRATLAGSSVTHHKSISVWHFCDNEQDANECAQLVLSGIKRATSPSVWELKASGDQIPAVGDLNMVTDWDGIAKCIIRTTSVDIVPFNKITQSHARLEGEGDGSLDYWKKVHWEYYHRVLKETDYTPSKDMPIVCEQFNVVYPEKLAV